MILPFAGLEMLGLLLAFYWVDRHAEDYERIAIAGDRLKVEHVEAGRTKSHELGHGLHCAPTAAMSRSAAT